MTSLPDEPVNVSRPFACNVAVIAPDEVVVKARPVPEAVTEASVPLSLKPAAPVTAIVVSEAGTVVMVSVDAPLTFRVVKAESEKLVIVDDEAPVVTFNVLISWLVSEIALEEPF